MPFRKISRDLKLAAIRLYEQGVLSAPPDILDCLQLSKSTFYRITWSLAHDWRCCLAHLWHPWKASNSGIWWYRLSEASYLAQTWLVLGRTSIPFADKPFHCCTLCYRSSIACAGWSFPQKTEKGGCRARWKSSCRFHSAYGSVQRLNSLASLMKCQRTRELQRGLVDDLTRATRAVKKGVFICGRRFSAEGLLTIDGIISNTVVEASMTCRVFLEYLEHSVVHNTFIGLWVAAYTFTFWPLDAIMQPLSWVTSVFLWWTMHVYITVRAF